MISEALFFRKYLTYREYEIYWRLADGPTIARTTCYAPRYPQHMPALRAPQKIVTAEITSGDRVVDVRINWAQSGSAQHVEMRRPRGQRQYSDACGVLC